MEREPNEDTFVTGAPTMYLSGHYAIAGGLVRERRDKHKYNTQLRMPALRAHRSRSMSWQHFAMSIGVACRGVRSQQQSAACAECNDRPLPPPTPPRERTNASRRQFPRT